MKTSIILIIIWLIILTIVVGYMFNKNRLYKNALGDEAA